MKLAYFTTMAMLGIGILGLLTSELKADDDLSVFHVSPKHRIDGIVADKRAAREFSQEVAKARLVSVKFITGEPAENWLISGQGNLLLVTFPVGTNPSSILLAKCKLSQAGPHSKIGTTFRILDYLQKKEEGYALEDSVIGARNRMRDSLKMEK